MYPYVLYIYNRLWFLYVHLFLVNPSLSENRDIIYDSPIGSTPVRYCYIYISLSLSLSFSLSFI